jgi:pseudoazurin
MSGLKKAALLSVIISTMITGTAGAAETNVKVLTQGPGPDNMMAPGDTVHFVATDKGHNVESFPGMLPDGATPFTSKMGEDVTAKFDKPGVYGIRCKPHYGLGMVALVVVGSPVNEDAAKAIVQPGKAKLRFAKLFADLDAGKPASK